MRLSARTDQWRYLKKRQVIDPQKRYLERKELEQKQNPMRTSERSAK